MWLNKLKIAIIEKNIDNLDKLMDEIPQLESTQEIQEAIYLLKQATEIVSSLRNETAHSMKQIQKNLKFLRSTESAIPNKLDIKL